MEHGHGTICRRAEFYAIQSNHSLWRTVDVNTRAIQLPHVRHYSIRATLLRGCLWVPYTYPGVVGLAPEQSRILPSEGVLKAGVVGVQRNLSNDYSTSSLYTLGSSMYEIGSSGSTIPLHDSLGF